MTDEKLLNEAIKASGLKKEYIASALGVTIQSLRNKISGRTEFTAPEVSELANILNLNAKSVDRIFFKSRVFGKENI